MNSYKETQRQSIKLKDGDIDTISSRRGVFSFVDKTSSPRSDLAVGQISNSVTPVFTESPIVDSALGPEIWAKSTCVKEAVGDKLTLIKKITYQNRTVYVYKLNGIIEIYDTNKLSVNAGFATRMRTDLDELKEGEEVTLDPKYNKFYIKYNDQFDPHTRIMRYGNNIRYVCETNLHNAGDSVCVSQSFVNKFIKMKSKTIHIDLKNKYILSEYPEIFPQIGKLITNPILCRVVDNENGIGVLTQTNETPAGLEDDVIILEDNSYIHGIEVYCNDVIQNEHLEKLRLSYRDFRNEVYSTLAQFDETALSDEAKIMKEYCRVIKFRDGDAEIKYPLIRLTIVTLDVPGPGYKFSNVYGGKVTIQEVYPDGTYVDQYGRPIEMLFPSTAIINRAIAGIMYEQFLGGIADLLRMRVGREEITKEKAYEFCEKVYDTINLKSEWDRVKFTVDELWEYLHHHYIKFITMPYSNGLDIATMRKLGKIANDYIGFEPMRIYLKEGDGYIEQQTGDTPLAACVGMLYMFMDEHDPFSQNSVSDKTRVDIQGLPKDKDNDKKLGRAVYGRQSAKLDIQCISYILGLLTNEDANVMLNKDACNHYAIIEHMNAAGIDMHFNKKGEKHDKE
jgi:hypothetical protein